MTKRTATSPKKPVRRVAAWIYAVINPIISSLERELFFLDSGNLTWRPQTGRCEMIRPIQEYVDSTQWPNYQDFLAEHQRADFGAEFQHHDSNLNEVNALAQRRFDSTLSSTQFRDFVNSELDIYERQKLSLGPQAPSLTNIRTDIPKMVAEYLINNAQNLPSHYVISAFWNFNGKNLLAIRAGSDFQPLRRSAENLGKTSAVIKQGLEDYRLSLSRSYDVPAAPVSGIWLEQHALLPNRFLAS
jgi:hypothetical protein